VVRIRHSHRPPGVPRLGIAFSPGSSSYNSSISKLCITIVLTLQETEWFDWFNSDAPEVISFPMGYEKSLNQFQKLMLLRCFRIDRIYRAVEQYVTLTMGEKYVTPPIIRYVWSFSLLLPLKSL